MPWTPAYEASQEEALVDNVHFIFQRDFKAALDQRYPIEAALPADDPRHLKDFQERGLGQILGNAFPSLAIAPHRGSSSDGPNGERLGEDVLIHVHIGVVDDSHDNVTRRVMRYRATADMALRSANISDYLRNMSTESFGFVNDRIDYFYGPIGEEKSVLFRMVLMQLHIQINER